MWLSTNERISGMSIKDTILATLAGFVITAVAFGIHTPSTAKCDICGAEKNIEQMVQLSGDNSIVFRCYECV